MDPRSPPSCDYAAPGALLAATLTAFLPPARLSVPDWAATSRYLFNQCGGYVGLWDHTRAPYLIGPMEALNSHLHTTTAIVGPGQSGKTAVAENWLGQSIETDPADFLWYMQTDASLEAYVKDTIDAKLIESHPELLARRGLNRSDNSIHFKRFRGMTAQFLSAVPANLINKNAPRIVADEYDAYEQFDEDPKALLDVRRQTYGRESMLAVLSHPDRALGAHPRFWTRGIMALYAASDRRLWWWRCPQCGCYSSPNPSAAHHMSLACADPAAPLDEIEESTYLLCPHHGCIATNADRRSMNLAADWVGTGQTIDVVTGEINGALASREIAGFWIVGVMSPFLFGGIGGYLRRRIEAERAVEQGTEGAVATLRQIVVKQGGIPFDPPRAMAALDATALADRAEPYARGTVPAGVRFITAFIDNQGNRWEALFRGWGIDRESWVLDHWTIKEINGSPVSPATSPADWDDMLDRVMDAAFPLADGTGRVMRVHAVGYDNQGEPGVTAQANAAWLRQRKRHRARLLGIISGRHAYTLLPTRGASARDARNLTITLPDLAKTDRRAAARGEIPLGTFNPNAFKDGLRGQLATAEPGPGYVHFPDGLRSREPPHVFFEQLLAEERSRTGEWTKTAARNEALDLMVGAAVMAHLHAPSRFNWASPPAWAAEWDRNRNVAAAPVTIAVPPTPRQGIAQMPPPAAVPTDIRARIRAAMAARQA